MEDVRVQNLVPNENERKTEEMDAQSDEDFDFNSIDWRTKVL